MAIPVARVHLKVAHAALPALLPTPPQWKMLPPFVAAILPKPPAKAKPSHADSDERWDARKTKPAGAQPPANIVRSNTGHGSSRRKNVISPPPKPSRCRADSMERWDAHKNAASPASSPSSSATSSLVSNSKWRISRASSSSERSRSTSTSRYNIDDIEDTEEEEEEEEIVWKPRAMYAGPGFVVAAPQPCMIPMPTSFLVPVA